MGRDVRRVFWLGLFLLGTSLIIPASSGHAQQSQNVGVGVGDTVLDISGLSSPGAFISVYDSSSLIGTFTAANDGSYNHAISAQEGGIRRLRVTAQDSAGRLSDAASLEVNLQKHFHTSVYIFVPTTLQPVTILLAGNQPLELKGQTIPSGIITFYIDGQPQGSATADADGMWSASLVTAGLADGSHGIFGRVTDGLGNQSYPTRTQTFTVSRPQTALPIPLQPAPKPLLTFSQPTPPPPPTILTPAANTIFKQSRVVLTGNGSPLTLIELWNEQQAIGAVFTDARGNWKLPHEYLVGDHRIRARSCIADLCGSFSNEVRFSYRPDVPAPLRFRANLEKYRHTKLIPDQKGSVTLQLAVTEGNPPYEVSVDWGDGRKDISTAPSRDITLRHQYAEAGKYSGRVVIKNAVGSQDLYFAVNVFQKTPLIDHQLPPAVIAGLLVSGFILTGLLRVYLSRHPLRTSWIKRGKNQ